MKYEHLLLFFGLIFLGCVFAFVRLSQAGAKSQARQEKAMKE